MANDEKLLIRDFTTLGQYGLCDSMKSTILAPRCWLAYNPLSGAITPRLIEMGTGITAKPNDGMPWRWRAAKMVVGCAEFNYQELVEHLGRRHLTGEVFVMETMRSFRGQTNNPLYRLLLPHMERCLAVNNGAAQLLVPWLGNYLSAFRPETLSHVIADAVHNFDCATLDFEHDLRLRGFDPDALPPTYYYATDGLEIWRSLLPFFQSVLINRLKDLDWTAIDKWTSNIRARLPSFPTVTDVGDLARVATGMAFQMSVLHSTVNDPQYYFYGYVPNCPGRLCTAVPLLQDCISWTDSQWHAFYFQALPGSKQADFQREMLSVLALAPPASSELMRVVVEDYAAFVDAAETSSLLSKLQSISALIQKRNDYPYCDPAVATRSVIR
jgi:hypothetical protein